MFWVYQNGNFLPGKSISPPGKKSGKMTLPPQKNMPVTPLPLTKGDLVDHVLHTLHMYKDYLGIIKEQCKNSRLQHLLMIVVHGETLWSPAPQRMGDDDVRAIFIRPLGSAMFTATFNLVRHVGLRNFWSTERWKSFD